MEQGLDLTTVALLAILVIGVFLLFIRQKPGVSAESATKPVCGGKDSARVTLNAPPEAHPPFVQGNGEWGEIMKIDVRYREHGCDAGGAPTLVTGVFDPDNELLEFWFEVVGPNRDGQTIPYAVSDNIGRRVDGKWLPREYFPVCYRNRNDPTSPPEQNALVSCFVGHTADKAPIPMGTSMACGCKGNCEEVYLPEQDLGKKLGDMRITYKARDPHGEEVRQDILFPIYSGSCS